MRGTTGLCGAMMGFKLSVITIFYKIMISFGVGKLSEKLTENSVKLSV